MDAHLSRNSSFSPLHHEPLDTAQTSPSSSDNDSELGCFDDHVILATAPSKKRDFCSIPLHSLSNTPDELEKHEVTEVSKKYKWNPDAEKAMHDESKGTVHWFSDTGTDTESQETLEQTALDADGLFEDWEQS